MSLQVAKIRGIPIRLHFTLVIVVILISWTIAETLMPQMYPHQGLTNVHYWIMGILGAAILFVSGFNTLVYVIHYCKITYTGIVMIAERFANDKLKDNLNPVGHLFYASSTMVCVPA